MTGGFKGSVTGAGGVIGSGTGAPIGGSGVTGVGVTIGSAVGGMPAGGFCGIAGSGIVGSVGGDEGIPAVGACIGSVAGTAVGSAGGEIGLGFGLLGSFVGGAPSISKTNLQYLKYICQGLNLLINQKSWACTLSRIKNSFVVKPAYSKLPSGPSMRYN